MKLKEGFVTQTVDDIQFLVPVSADAFSGVVRGNKTAAFIVDALKEDTTEEKIVDAMFEKFDASKQEIASCVKEIIKTLRGIHALDE